MTDREEQIPKALTELYIAEAKRPVADGSQTAALWSKIASSIGGGPGGGGPGGGEPGGGEPGGGEPGSADNSPPNVAPGAAQGTGPGVLSGATDVFSAGTKAVGMWSTVQLAGAAAATLTIGALGGWQASERFGPRASEHAQPQVTRQVRPSSDAPSTNEMDRTSALSLPLTEEPKPGPATVAGEKTESGAVHGKAARSRVRKVTTKSTLADERRLLDVARAALTTGNHARASTTLQGHRKRFPSGVLSEERDALEIRLVRAKGRELEAEDLLDAFEARYPKSLFLKGLGAD